MSRSLNMEGSPKAGQAKDEYDAFAAHREEMCAKILQFNGVGGSDVYNPSVPFISDGLTVMACRVQERCGNESSTVFFTKKGDEYYPVPNAPVLPLEDPFVTIINNEIILGGVSVDWDGDRALNWKTLFYRGSSILNLEEFAHGPDNMKDIRLLGLPDGRVAVCTRPQGQKMLDEHGCIAKIGFTTIPSLDDLTAEAIENATYLEGLFLPDEWGGANEMHLLENGMIGVVGHKAYKEIINNEDYLHYYGISFAIDPLTLNTSEISVISSRDCFDGIESRLPRLYDVTFTAGIVRKNSGLADLYTGLSDCQIGLLEIPDPMLRFL